MPISYDSPTNVISVVGGSEASPYSFEDLYQADQNNGWGVVEKAGYGSYYTKAHINIGDGTIPTYFVNNDINIEFDNSMISSSNRNFMLDFYGANIAFTDCNFLFRGELATWGRLNLMRANATRCSFINEKSIDLIAILNQITQCLGKNVLFQPYGDVDYIFTYKKMFYVITDTINIRNVFVFDSTTCLRTMNSNAVVQNVRGYNNTYCYYSAITDNVPKTRYMINCHFDKWVVRLYTGSNPNDYAVFYRQYEIFLRVVDKNGVAIVGYKIEIYNKNNDKVSEIVSGNDYQKITLTYAKIDYKEKFPDKIGTNTYINAYEEDWDYYNPFTIKVWNGQELLYEGILKDEDYVNNPPVYIDIVANPSSFTLTDIMTEIQNHRSLVEPNIDVSISSRASQESVNAIPTNPLLADDPRLDNLDTSISSRSSHTPADVWAYPTRELTNPNNYKADVSDLAKEATVQAIKFQTDKLQFATDNDVKATLDGERVRLTSDIELLLNIVLGLVQHNYRLFNTTYTEIKGMKKLTSATVKIYSSRQDCENDVSPLKVYNLQIDYDENGCVVDYRSVES